MYFIKIYAYAWTEARVSIHCDIGHRTLNEDDDDSTLPEGGIKRHVVATINQCKLKAQ